MPTPTDDELGDMWYAAREASTYHDTAGQNRDARRALYNQGELIGYGQGWRDALDTEEKLWRARVDWLLTAEAAEFWDKQTEGWYRPKDVLKAFHDRITTGGEQ